MEKKGRKEGYFDKQKDQRNIRMLNLEKFAIIGSQTCGFRYNRILNICFAITTLETLTLCYYNIMAFK